MKIDKDFRGNAYIVKNTEVLLNYSRRHCEALKYTNIIVVLGNQ